MSDRLDVSRDKLVEDFSAVVSDVEALLKRASGETGERAKELRAQVEAKLLAAKLRLEELQGVATDKAKAAADTTDAYVHEHPWQAVGIAAAVGLVVGLLMSRR